MNSPPRISSAAEPAQDRAPVWAFAGMLLLLAGARFSLVWPVPLPFCLLKRITGIPCPLCGATRCLQACSRFDFGAALYWNPLAFAACAGIAAWFVVWAADRLCNRRWLGALRSVFPLRALKFGLLGVLVLNWFYLCIVLR
jgi:hypothetical protein